MSVKQGVIFLIVQIWLVYTNSIAGKDFFRHFSLCDPIFMQNEITSWKCVKLYKMY